MLVFLQVKNNATRFPINPGSVARKAYDENLFELPAWQYLKNMVKSGDMHAIYVMGS